jgi:uncharacterized membrane protein
MSLGERASDKLANGMGSWKFVFQLLAILVVWFIWNVVAPDALRFDPYPFILANLFMSAMAAFTAPVIMMAGNRQAAKDRKSLRETEEDTKEDLALDHNTYELLLKVAAKLEIT